MPRSDKVIGAQMVLWERPGMKRAAAPRHRAARATSRIYLRIQDVHTTISRSGSIHRSVWSIA